MEINADNAFLTPWYIHPSRVLCGRYLHPLLPGPHAYVDKLMNLRCDHFPNYLDDVRVQSGIVKPKAIRISNLRPFLNPAFPDHQATCPPDYGDHLSRYDRFGFNISCLPYARHGVITQPNALYSNFPYLFSCLSSFQQQHSTPAIEAENIFKEMLRGQMQFLNCRKTSYHKENGGKRCNFRADGAETSDLRFSLQPDYLKNDFLWENGGATSTEAVSECLQVPLKLYPKNSSMNSKVQEQRRHQTCVQKLKQKAVNNYRKHFMTPYTGNVNKDGIITKGLESRRSIIPKYARQMKQRIKNSEDVSLVDNNINSYASVESPTNVPKLKQDSDRLSLHCVNNELQNETTVNCEDESPKNNELNKVLTTAAYQPPQASIVDDKKTFKCPQCRYLTDRKNNLKRHIMTMHQDSSKSLECCGISFQNKAALRDHNSIFHRGGYRCQICSRNFCRKALLRRHLTVHSGQKDFFCEICGYATSHKSNLERHQKVHTKRDPSIGGIRKSGSVKRGLRLGAASFLSRAILNSRAQSLRYEEPDDTSALSTYQTGTKSLEADGALKQKSAYTMFIKESPDSYMNTVQIMPSLKNTLHDYSAIDFYQKGNYDCDNANINVKREDGEGPIPTIHFNTY